MKRAKDQAEGGCPGITPVTRLPKAQGPFRLLRPGSIHGEGWLGDYVRVIADGWTLHCARLKERWLFSVLWDRFRTPFPYPVEDQEAPDFCAYFTDGFLRLARMLPDSELRQLFDEWIEKVVASQDRNGYLGALDPPARWNNWLEIFHQCLLIEALIYNYEFTCEKRYLSIAERAARQPMKKWGKCGKMEPALYGGHGACIIRPMLRMYSLMGDLGYVDFACAVMKRYGKARHYLEGGDPGMQHNVCESEHVGLPAILYEYTGDKEYLEASLLAWDRMQKYLSVDGSPHGNEHTFRRRPRGNSEHCGSVEWSITNEHLVRITGQVKFADAAERAIYNAYPSAKSPDGLTLAYMHSPNQILATDWSGPQFDDPDYCDSKQYFSSAHSPLCCNVISHRAMPYFVDHMVMAAKDGLAVVLYGPCSVATALPGIGAVRLTQMTHYPFEDVVRIKVKPEREAEFTLHLRIPGWCASTAMKINGAPANVTAKSGTFAAIKRRWRPGDVVELAMNVPIRLEAYSEGYVRVGAVAVLRGPLTFALPIPEVWERFDSVHNAPLSEVISYRVFPKKGAAWNYALEIDPANPEKSFRLKKLEVPGVRHSREGGNPGCTRNVEISALDSRLRGNDGQSGLPWQYAPIGLEVAARRVLNWRQEGNEAHPMTPGLPFKPIELAQKTETITLVPFGCTRLRMTYLPVADAAIAGTALPATLIVPGS